MKKLTLKQERNLNLQNQLDKQQEADLCGLGVDLSGITLRNTNNVQLWMPDNSNCTTYLHD